MICKRSLNNIYCRQFTLEDLHITEEQIVVIAIIDRESKPLKLEGVVYGIEKPVDHYFENMIITLYPEATEELLNTTYWDWLYWNLKEWNFD